MKRCPIIICKHGIYQLSHELPNGFRLKDLWKLQNIRKLYKSYRMISYFPVFVPKMKIFLKLEKSSLNFTRSALFLMKIKVSLKYFINGCLWKHFLASNTPQTTSNLIFLTSLASPGVSQSFDLNLEQLSCEKC